MRRLFLGLIILTIALMLTTLFIEANSYRMTLKYSTEKLANISLPENRILVGKENFIFTFYQSWILAMYVMLYRDWDITRTTNVAMYKRFGYNINEKDFERLVIVIAVALSLMVVAFLYMCYKNYVALVGSNVSGKFS